MTDHSSPENADTIARRIVERWLWDCGEGNQVLGFVQSELLQARIREELGIRAQCAPNAWCQPMDQGKHTERTFLLYFEDADKGIATYTDEAEARRAFEQATLTWNCYLFGALPLTSPESQSEPDWKAVAEQAKAAGDKVLQDAKVSRAQLQVPYSQAHRDFVEKHGWPTQPAIQPQRTREAALEAAALDFVAKVERGEARSERSYQAFKRALSITRPDDPPQRMPHPHLIVGPNTTSGNENFLPSSGLDHSAVRLLLWFKSWDDAVAYHAALTRPECGDGK